MSGAMDSQALSGIQPWRRLHPELGVDTWAPGRLPRTLLYRRSSRRHTFERSPRILRQMCRMVATTVKNDTDTALEIKRSYWLCEQLPRPIWQLLSEK